MADDKRGHVIPLWRVQGKTPKSLPERVEDGPCREGGIVAESCDQALGAELVVPSKDLGQSVGVKQQPRSGREGEAFRLVAHPWDHAQRRAGCTDQLRASIRLLGVLSAPAFGMLGR